MFKNFLLISYRKAIRQKKFTFINIFGLCVGITAFILISLYVRFEYSFDKDMPDADNIYRIYSITHHTGTDAIESCTPFPLASALRLSMAEHPITHYYDSYQEFIFVGEHTFLEENILFVDSVFRHIFHPHWILGNPETALSEPTGIVLTDSLAEKYFGKENPLGKTIEIGKGNQAIVRGVVRSPAVNSSLPYKMIVPMDFLTADMLGFVEFKGWGLTKSGMNTIIKLPKGTDTAQIIRQITQVYSNTDAHPKNTIVSYKLQPFSTFHYNKSLVDIPGNYAVDLSFLSNLILIGLLILLAASFNFINLSTAQLVKHSKESGIRQVLGSGRREIILRHLTETAIIIFIGIFLAIILTEILLPVFNEHILPRGKLSIYADPGLFINLFMVWATLTLLTGLYPAWVISRSSPIDSIKNNIRVRKLHNFSLRKVFIVAQFSITTALIIAVLIIINQINYIKTKDLGYEKENTLIFSLPDSDPGRHNYIRSKMAEIPGIISSSIAIGAPASSSNMGTSFNLSDELKNDNFQLYLKPVDSIYQSLFGLKLIQGRWLNHKNEGDSIFETVVNECFLNSTGLEISEKTLGTAFTISRMHVRIVGIVKDFHFSSLRSKIKPLAFMYLPKHTGTLLVKHHPGQTEAVKKTVLEFLEKTYPGFIISYKSFNDHLDSYYLDDVRLKNIVEGFMLVALLIALLGLYGIISYALVQQTREIGIRKTFGASVYDIISRFNKEYIKLVLLGNILVWPIIYYFMNEWLQSFVYHTSMPWHYYVYVLLASLVLTYGSIAWQSLKTARMNPVYALRHE